MEYWENELRSFKQTPTQVAYFFLTSPELLKRNISDDDFLTILYRVCFDREPDAEGKAYWLEQIKRKGREYVAVSFLYSCEWSFMEEYLLYILGE